MTSHAFSPSGARPARPAPGLPREYHFPRFERFTLPNGVKVLVAPIHKLPVVSIRVLTEAGAVCDPPGQEGLAQLQAKLLLEGTEAMDGAELIARFEALGASVDAAADWDIAAVGMTTLADNARPAFELLGEVLRTPAFSEREIERLRGERRAELLQLRAEPRGLADESFTRVLYESASRYAKPDGGDETSVAAVDRDALVRFHRERYVPEGTTVIVAGDLSVKGAEALVQGALGDWAGGTVARVTTSDQPARRTRAAHVVEKEDAPQSEVRIGHVGEPRTHPDYFAITVMNAVLGGLFNSRINLNLREAHGYTYGAFAGFDWRRQAGPFVASSAVKTDVTGAACREVLKEIDRMRDAPIDAEELSLATSYLSGVFPIRFETTAAIAAALSSLVVYELPDDYFDTYRDRVNSVTVDDVLRAAQAHLHPDAMQVVVVGDPAVVRGQMAGFGPLLEYDAEGRLLAG